MHAQVGNYTLERAMWQRPEDMRNRRPVYYVATKNGAQRPGQRCRAATYVKHLQQQQWLVSRPSALKGRSVSAGHVLGTRA